MKKILLASLLYCVSHNAFAGWHYDSLLGVNVYENGGITITVSTEHECGSQVITLSNPTSEYADRILSVLLSHQAQNKPINFAIQSCSGTNAVIDRVRTY